MIIRKIKPEEYFKTCYISSRVFELENKQPEDEAAELKRIQEDPHNRFERNYLERWAAFKDDDKTMMAYFLSVPFECYYDGALCKLGGIGNVSTLPQYRNEGAIRACFDKFLKDAYEDDYALSYLYPFSHAFYRKFGYEVCEASRSYTLDFRALSKIEVQGNIELVDDRQKLLRCVQEVHDGMPKYNLISIHDSKDYNSIIYNMNCKTFNYIYTDKKGVAKGHLRYHKDIQNGRSVMVCDKFTFADDEGLRGVLKAAQLCSTTYDLINFRLSAYYDFDISQYVCDYNRYHNECKEYYPGMVRVINVDKILRMSRYKGDGEISIKIKDEQVPQNNGIFKVVFKDGRAESVEKGTSFDVEMDIATFSKLIMGVIPADRVRDVRSINIVDATNIEKVFYKKPIVMVDGF